MAFEQYLNSMKRFYLLLCLFIVFLGSCQKEEVDPQPINTLAEVPVVEEFTISQDSILLNPYGYAPLSAVVKYTTAIAGKTKITVKGKNGEDSDIVQEFDDLGLSHSVPITGLYADYENTVDISLNNEIGQAVAHSTITIKTNPLPANLPTFIEVNAAQIDKMESGLNLVSSFSRYETGAALAPLIVDNYGDIRWLLDYSKHYELKNLFFDCGISRLKNGNYYFADVINSKIYEVGILGQILNTWSMPGYTFHHEVYEKPDGNFLASVSKPGSTHPDGTPTTEDYIIEISRQSGSIVNEWDLKESLDEHRTALTTDTYDWIHINAVNYDPSDNTIIISGRTQGVIKLTYDNRVKWILSPHKEWGKNRRGEDLNQFLLTPLDANSNPITDPDVLIGNINHPDFEWSWYQHSPIFMPNGNLMLFDNGDIRNYDPLAERYSRAVEYKIDKANMTIQQKWSYGKERGLETFSRIVSSVKFLPGTNHVLFSPGYQVENHNGKGGKIVEIDYASKQVVFEMEISSQNNWGFHRTERIELYPFSSVL